nr:hypothetical protein [Tanacetum cinerariifolium]
MTTLVEHIIVARAENHPPMLEKSMYDSWASHICLSIKGMKNGRTMLDSIDNGPLIYPTVEENRQTRPKTYSKLTEAQQLQDDCDVQATTIILHGLPPDVYALVNHQEAGETLYEYYRRFSQLINDMHTIRITMQQVQVNTNFLNALSLKWSKFVTDVKLAKSLYTTNYDQLKMTTLAEHIIVAKAENHPPMLEKSMYDSWASHICLFIKGMKNGRTMLDSIDNGPLIYPTVEDNRQTRPKTYSKLTEAQQLQDDCDVQATTIILHGLPPDVYALVNHQEAGETLYEYYRRFSQLINDMHTIRMTMQQVQVNTKFLNALSPKWSKFVTDVKLAKSLYTTNYDQLGSTISDVPSFSLNDCRLSKLLCGTVRFENDHIDKIIGYGDYQIRNVTISQVYYVEGLGHNLFSMGQFCDSDLEVAFRKHSCFIRDLEGVDLLKGSRLSHLNFDYITSLAKHGLVQGHLKLKYQKDHLYSACALVIPLGVEEADHDIEVAHMDNNPYVDFPIPEPSFEESSSQAEAQVLPTNDARVVMTFLKKLFCHFEMPKALISDRDNPAIWSRKLDDALWAFRTAYKTPTDTTPYKLIYGKNCHLPFEIEHHAYWALKNCNPDMITGGEK